MRAHADVDCITLPASRSAVSRSSVLERLRLGDRALTFSVSARGRSCESELTRSCGRPRCPVMARACRRWSLRGVFGRPVEDQAHRPFLVVLDHQHDAFVEVGISQMGRSNQEVALKGGVLQATLRLDSVQQRDLLYQSLRDRAFGAMLVVRRAITVGVPVQGVPVRPPLGILVPPRGVVQPLPAPTPPMPPAPSYGVE